MQSAEFEMKLLKRYGSNPIPREDVYGVLEEAVENNVIEREELGECHGECSVPELMQMLRRWRTDFLKDSFSINDMCSYDDGRGRSDSRESFVTTDDAFLSSLRDKTRVITERGACADRRAIRSILRAWEEYERLPVRRTRRYWYVLLPVLLAPLCLLYVREPF